jgi:hypothetical protein
MTPLKSQTDFTSPLSSFKGKIQQKYFNGKYPHTIHFKNGVSFITRYFSLKSTGTVKTGLPTQILKNH